MIDKEEVEIYIKTLNWWLRSANVAFDYLFFDIVLYGAGTNTANNISGIAPAFCI